MEDSRIAEAVDHIVADGYYIMRNALPESFCDEILEEIRKMEEDLRVPLSLQNDFHGYKTARFFDLLNYGEVWQRLAVHPNLLPVMKGVLGDDCLLNTYGTSIIGPGEKSQPIHVDDGTFISQSPALRRRPRIYEGGPRSSISVNTMIALCDFTEEIGATRIVPDSNKMPYPKPTDSEKNMKASIPAVMPKGSILFFEGQCYHAGGANLTLDQRRFGVTVSFCAGYLRTQENFILSIPEEKAASFPRELQQLIGFRISKGGLGHIYNHNPVGMMKTVAMRNSTAYYKDGDAHNLSAKTLIDNEAREGRHGEDRTNEAVAKL